VHYQPIVELGRAGVVGVEALVRWNHPERGFIPPMKFIPLAEESGLIGAVGNFVLERAAHQVATWNRERTAHAPLSVSVNLSVRQLESADLVDIVRDVLTTSGLAPHLLCLEITETALLADAEASRVALERLKELGIRLAVDDFGTGYASLRYLRQFPVDLLKIDRSFVSGLGESSADSAIVGGVLGLARALGLEAVAEGVETEGQADELSLLGCRQAQGYHWAKPMAPEELAQWLDGFWASHSVPRREVKQVLLVDADADVRRVLRVALELHGCEVVAEARDTDEAIALARKHEPDLIVLDPVVTGLDGAGALQRLQEAAPGSRVAILSGSGPGTVDPRVLLGAAAHFEKDADLIRLAEQLLHVIPA
jgi:EAL domain-containing protein (putative c-di-GMP-specific phosphodiesterase class I)/CheY-like chemotaxis protein